MFSDITVTQWVEAAVREFAPPVRHSEPPAEWWRGGQVASRQFKVNPLAVRLAMHHHDALQKKNTANKFNKKWKCFELRSDGKLLI